MQNLPRLDARCTSQKLPHGLHATSSIIMLYLLKAHMSLEDASTCPVRTDHTSVEAWPILRYSHWCSVRFLSTDIKFIRCEAYLQPHSSPIYVPFQYHLYVPNMYQT